MRAKSAFGEFFRDAYQPLLRDVIFAGGHPDEAEDAVSAAMVEVLERWNAIANPRAYARRTAINNMIKSRQRGLQRISERLIQQGDVPLEGDEDPGLLVWEQQEWVTRHIPMRKSPPRCGSRSAASARSGPAAVPFGTYRT